METKLFLISYDSVSVVGVTESAPKVSMREVSASPRYGHDTILLVQHDGDVYVTKNALLDFDYAQWVPYTLGRRAVAKVTEETWLAWAEHNEYERRSDRERWAQKRNSIVLDFVLSLMAGTK